MADKAPILMRLNDDKKVPCHPCDCGHCGNEWFVPGYSDEWNPSFCPYCGIKFVRHTEGDDETPMPFRPSRPLVWSSERPKVVGKWAVRHKDEAERDFVKAYWWVIDVDAARLSAITDVNTYGLEFAGPIPEPLEPS